MKLVRTELRPSDYALEETLFHVANGYIGIRGSFEEGCPPDLATVRGCYINGFYDTVTLSYPEKLYGFPEEVQRLVNLPDAQTTRVFFDGEEFSPFTGTIVRYERCLDTETGTAVRHIDWLSPMGKHVEIKITRMASFARRELFLTVFEIVSRNFEGQVEFVSEINCDVSNFFDSSDPRVASEQIKHIFAVQNEQRGDVNVVRCRTGVSGLELVICQKHTGAASARIKPGESVRSEKYTVFCDSRCYDDLEEYGLETMRTCVSMGAEMLLKEQKEYLDGFWRTSCVTIDAVIDGPKDIEDGMQFNLFQLLQSAGGGGGHPQSGFIRSSREVQRRDAMPCGGGGLSSVAAKGISGEGYEGHYFWDTEIYIFPFFLFTQPQIAKNLLDFRYNTLDGARAHAKIMGHGRGALYPWRTIAGSECSSYFPSGSAQYHITGDVAHSFLQYFYATGDIGYMEEKGAEVLIETARLWLDAGNYDSAGTFHIHNVTGPDEYSCIVSDNYYTNQCAKANLLGAVNIYKKLKERGLHERVRTKTGFDENELAELAKAAENIALIYDEKLGIHAQDAAFLSKPVWDIAATPKDKFPLLLHYHPLYLYRHQVCKQADIVLAHFLYEDGTDEDVLKRSYEYYEKITTHDSSLSKCVYSIMASRLGFHEKAYDYFACTVRTDLDNTHGNTKDGIHTANMGGAWLALVCGFAGLRLTDGLLSFKFTLPAGWNGYSFKLYYQGSLLRVAVDGAGAEISLEEGEPADVVVNGVRTCVSDCFRI